MAFAFLSAVNSFAFDYVTRQKLGGSHMNFFILNQLPAPPPGAYNERVGWIISSQVLRDWLLPRVLELTYTAWDLQPFAQDCGYPGPPFRWDEERRFLLRCELDAAFFHLYLTAEANGDWRPAETRRQKIGATQGQLPHSPRAVDYIMDTFPIVKRKDEAKGTASTAPSASSSKSTTPWPKPPAPASPTRPACRLRPPMPPSLILAGGTHPGSGGQHRSVQRYRCTAR